MNGAVKPIDDVGTLHVAMQWTLLLREGEASEQDIAEWMAWYEREDGNKKAFDEMQQFWGSLGELATGAEGAQRLKRLRGPGMPQPAMPRRVWWLAAAAAVVLALVMPLLWFQVFDGTEHSTMASQVREQLLPDGSRVQLAAKSSVILQYTGQRRFLQMQGGEAYFSVAPNRNQPFVVQVGNLQVRAVGTAFNIRHAADRTVVTVTEGSVDVYTADSSQTTASSDVVRVSVGRELKWDQRGELRQVTEVSPSHALAWREGRLEYIDEPLSAVIADVNRYTDNPIAIRDGAVAQLTYTGTVFVDSIDEWLKALPGEFPVRLLTAQDQSVTLISR